MPSAQLTSPSSPVIQPVRQQKANWLHAPQRVWLRRAIFQIHLWLGILLAAYSVIIGLTGAVLVFNDEIEDAIYARQLHMTPSAKQTSFDRIIADVEAARPGWKIGGLSKLGPGAGGAGFDDEAVLLVMRPAAKPTTTNLRYVYVDPNTGKVLLDRMRYAGFLGFVFHMHLYLMLERIGLTISGWMALGLLLLCISGIVVWWPGITRWAAALVLRKRASWKRFNWDLHSVSGFWFCLPLAAVSLTGVYFAFPLFIAGPIVKLTGGDLREAIKYVALPKAEKVPPGTPVLPIDSAIAKINAQMKSEDPAAPAIFYLSLPQTAQDIYGGIAYYPTRAQYTAARRVALDPHSGKVLLSLDTRKAPIGVRIVQYFHSVHFGTFAGTKGALGYTVRALWVLLGIAPALLAVTGLIMYWNRKLRGMWKRLVAVRN